MWDPDYMNYLLGYFEEQGIELPPSYMEDEEALEQAYEEEEEEEEEYEDEDDEYEDDNEEETDDGADVEVHHGMSTSGLVLSDNHGNGMNPVGDTSSREAVDASDQVSDSADEVIVVGERASSSQRRNNTNSNAGQMTSLNGEFNIEVNNEGELNKDKDEIDGLFCPICFDAWSSGGDHHVCCLPCGHIYGLSCIKKWLRRQGSSKCPQCKKKCGIKDIRLLYASRIVAIDGELQKKVWSLEVKCASIEKKNADLSKKEEEWKKREADLCRQMRHLKERTRDLEDLLEDMENRRSGSFASSWNYGGEAALGLNVNPKFHMQECSSKFVLQKDFQVDGARFFDIDSSNKFFVIARRLSGLGGRHVLTKMSLLSDHEKEDIPLSVNMKAVKDLRVSPHSGLVLLASLGKALSVLSTESNNTILTYDLPAAAWSCSWDICSSHYLYAGLQNGTVLQFDLRHTLRHVESLTGLTGNPIHTVHALSPDRSQGSSVRSVLTASSLGICHWNFGRSEERPYLIPESEKQGVCISLAYCLTSDDIVASFRPKIEVSGDLEISQPISTASTSVSGGHGVQGSHVLFKKMGSTHRKFGAARANVSDIRLPKSAIIEGVSENPVFASGDEGTCELILQELPSLMVVEHLKPRKYPIRDVKYTSTLSYGLLSCLSEDSLQLFTPKPF